MFLLDTMVLSELEEAVPNAGLVRWVSRVDWNDVYLSVVTVAEIVQGISRLPHSAKRRAYEASLDLLPLRFEGRILPVDYGVAVEYGRIQGELGPLPALDTFIAATAIVHRQTVVTRNTKDIGRTGARVLDPWT
jgi:predicted nucleic acid-binding protein